VGVGGSAAQEEQPQQEQRSRISGGRQTEMEQQEQQKPISGGAADGDGTTGAAGAGSVGGAADGDGQQEQEQWTERSSRDIAAASGPGGSFSPDAWMSKVSACTSVHALGIFFFLYRCGPYAVSW